MADKIEFQMPDAIKDFVFDLHDASRRSMRIEEVETLYDHKFREVTDKFFPNSAWPDSAAIASECGDDGVFLLFYRELTLRHAITKLKPQLIDHIEAWNNYCKLFHYLQHNLQTEMVISYQWACDLVSEFVYQFQGFCQYRTLINNKNEDEISILENNPDLWSVGIVFRILNDLVRVAKLNNSKQGGIESNRIHEVLGYFAIIELARLECLLADYHSSLKWSAMVVPYLQGASSSANQGQASSLINGVPVALYNTIPICHINVYYHAGVSLLMMHRYTDAMRIFNEIIMHISQRLLKQGNIIGNRPGTQLQLQRMLDRILALTGLCVVLYPCVYSSAASSSSTDTQRHHGNGVQVISDQAKEMIEAHLGDKYRQLQNGDALIFENIFENSTPKFISAALPNYHVKDEDENYVCHDAIKTQLHVFGSRIRQELSTLKLKSYLKLYTSIGIDKLSRYDGDNSSSEDSMVSKLLSMKHKTAEVQASAGFSNVPNVSILDVNYHIDGNVLVIDNANAHKAAKNGRKQLPNMQFYENVFSSTIRSNQALAVDIEKSFEKHGL